MSCSDSAAPGMAGLLLQRVIVDRPVDRQGLYWRDYPNGSAAPGADGRVERVGDTLLIPPGAVLNFGTYFNAFYESMWRRHTGLGTILLRVTVEGRCTLRLTRRAVGGTRVVHEQVVASETVTVAVDDDARNFRQHGLLAFELATGAEAARFIEGAWLDADGSAGIAAAGLSAVMCTFNREADVTRLVASIAADRQVAECLAAVFVINQGRPGLGGSDALMRAGTLLDGKLRVIDQPNFGGAGGFSRGLLEAIGHPATTHAVLLDDDITLEPDSLLRMAAFFALCRKPVVLGGHMLDSVQPTLLYEAGAIISDRHWAFQPQHHSQNLLDDGVLDVLTQPNAIHYNGWWCCGIPLSLIREYGMPLPCFIRGDDLEFGLRLHQAGVPTVAMPGVAVWHEPFYLKIGSWHLYYETRNMLIAAALHQPGAPWEVVRRMGRQLVMNLLTFRYYNAALIIAGIEDFLAGPRVLEGSPQAVHARVAAIRQLYPLAATGREVVLETQRVRPPPRSTAGYLFTLARLTVRNLVAPTRNVPARLLQVHDLSWPLMRAVDHVAVETWWDEERPTFKRSREHFRTLAAAAARALAALYRKTPATVGQWQSASRTLTSLPFWRAYLGLPAAASRESASQPAQREAARSRAALAQSGPDGADLKPISQAAD